MLPLSQPRLPGPRPLLTAPTLPTALELSCGLPEGAAYPGEVSLDVSASKAAQGSPQFHGSPSPQLQKTRQGGGRTSAQRRSSHASGSAVSLRTPADSEEERVSPRAGRGVRRPAGRMKGRWIPGETKGFPGPADP